MVSINLGNIVGNTISGIASGLDSAALIDDLSAIRKKPIDTLNLQITKNQSTITEYGNLRNTLTKLKNSINYLRNPSNILNSYSNAFEYRRASISSSTITSSSYLSVTANPGAQVGNSTIQIGSIAKTLEQRSASFNSRNTDATTAATGAYFTAGTFQIGSGVVNNVDGDTLSGFTLSNTDYSVSGSATGVLTAGGIQNFTVTGGSGGLTSLEGGISGMQALYNAGSETVRLTFLKNDVLYISDTVAANTSINAGANTGLASGSVFTFTGDDGGVNETSFTITLDEDIIIDGSQANADSFAEDVDDALASQSIYQSRKIENFVNANVKSPLTGLTNNNIRFVSDEFDLDNGEFGEITGFEVKYSTGSDGAISVDIDGETFRVTGLGTTLSTNLTLTSTTTSKQLKLNLGDAAVSASINSKSNATALERALDYAFGTRELVDVTVASGDSLNDVVFTLNQNKNETGVSASVIQVSEFDFRLSLKANDVGIDNKYEIFDTSAVLTNASLSTIQSAADALISVDGVEIERSTNSISDAIENVTLDLLQVTPDYGLVSADEIDVAINNDVDLVTERVVAFLDAYNEFRVYEAEQNQRDIDTGEYLETAILGGDNILKSLADQIANEILGVVSGVSDSNYSSLANIGILVEDFAGDSETIETSNILVYDESALSEAISNNFDKIREIFELQTTISSSSLALYKSSNNFTITDFKLEIDTTQDEGEQVKLLNPDGTDYLVDGDPVYLSLEGGIITGLSDTVVAGLEFVYSGDGSETISVTLTQGIADKIYNVINSFDEDSGIIDDTVETLTDTNDDYETEIIDLEERLETYIETLRAKFAALEQAVNSSNSVLSLLAAQDAARNASNN